MKIVILCNMTTGIDFPLSDSNKFRIDHKAKTLTYLQSSYPILYTKVHYETLKYKPVHGVLFIEYLETSTQPVSELVNNITD